MLLVSAVTLGLGVVIAGVVMLNKSTLSTINKIKKDAEKAYMKQEFDAAFDDLKLLLDSLQQKGDEEKTDLAHAGFHLMRFDTTAAQDSAAIRKQLEYAESLNHYRDIAAQSQNGALASTAYNQLGVSAVKVAKPKELADEERTLNEAAAYFRSALEKDADNDAARYNYELVRRRIELPEIILAKVKEMVRKRQYKAARNLLKETLQKSPRTKEKFGEIINRIQTIITIDSVSHS